MIGVVLVTHGKLAEEFISALEHVVGKQKQMAAISIESDDDMEDCRSKILAATKSADTGDWCHSPDRYVWGNPIESGDLHHGASKCRSRRRHKFAYAHQVGDQPGWRRIVGSRGLCSGSLGRKYINVASTLLADRDLG